MSERDLDGDKLRELRERRGWTQVDLAFRAQIAPSLVSRIENHQRPNPQLGTLRRLAHALGMTLADFLRALGVDVGEVGEEDTEPLPEPLPKAANG